MTAMQHPSMRVRTGHFVTQFQSSIIALAVLSVFSVCALAQDSHSHALTPQQQELTPEQRDRAGALIKIVREATERFKDVAQAEKEGYALQFGCVSGPDNGAMGLHFVNGALVNGGVVDANRPQIVIY